MTETAKQLPKQRLRYERERRGWSQQDVADKVGTTPLNVSRWERGETVPGPFFRLKLSEVFEKSPYELGLVSERSTSSLSLVPSSTLESTTDVPETHTLFWNVPYRRNSFFTGREQVLDRLRAALVAQAHSIAIPPPQAISGMGGIGKTQLAIEYAYRYRDDYQAVFWVCAESTDLIVSDFLTIAALLNLPERNEQEQQKTVNAVLRWFDTHERWLLILDNADDLEMAAAFIPASGKGHVLLTTRAHSAGTIAQIIELEKMGLEEGTLFLLRRIKYLRENASLEAISGTRRTQAHLIAETMDGLPLAIDQAGAYVEETGCSLSDYLKFYKMHRNRLLRTRGRDAVGHPEPVATTWSLSFEKVEQANPAAAELLRFCAFLHPDTIPEAMIMEGASELGAVLQPVARDELELNDAIGEIYRYSLIKRDAEIKVLNIHRLVQATLRNAMSKEMQKKWAERTVRAVNKAFPEAEFANWPRCQQYLPHAQACAELIRQWGMMFAEASRLLHCSGRYLHKRGRYGEAELPLQQAFNIRENMLEAIHPDLAQSLNDLGALYCDQAKYQQAESFYRRALSIREQKFGLNHSSVAEVLNNLGVLYWLQSGYDQAEPLFRRALAIYEYVYGAFHPHVADCLSNLGVLSLNQRKYAEAEPLLQQAITIYEHVLGPLHPDLANTLNELAIVYREQGRYERSEALFLHALSIREHILGSNHPELAKSLNNLAILYRYQERYAEAEPLLQRALSIREQSLGPSHPIVALTLENYVHLLRQTNREAEALIVEARVQAIQAKQGSIMVPRSWTK